MTKQLLIRKTHRYLGLIIGIQFLGWTVSGLYFSWNNIDDVHGDHLRRNKHFISSTATVAPPNIALEQLRNNVQVDSLHSIHLISIIGKPVYQISYFSGHVGEGAHHHLHYALADGVTGNLRPPLSKDEAIAVAKENIIEKAKLTSVVYLEKTDGHHEFRKRPLPAWAVSFEDPNCTVYISAELAAFQAVRHSQWRVFDFLWMFHTMDYESRDNFNNWLLKAFSFFGLITVLSGFLLYIVSSKKTIKIQRKKAVVQDR